MSEIKTFEDLNCWKACRELSDYVLVICKQFPRDFDMISNMKRAARSTTRNIAEGYGRHHDKENMQFCRISRGSQYEVLDDFISAEKEGYISKKTTKKRSRINRKSHKNH